MGFSKCLALNIPTEKNAAWRRVVCVRENSLALNYLMSMAWERKSSVWIAGSVVLGSLFVSGRLRLGALQPLGGRPLLRVERQRERESRAFILIRVEPDLAAV